MAGFTIHVPHVQPIRRQVDNAEYDGEVEAPRTDGSRVEDRYPPVFAYEWHVGMTTHNQLRSFLRGEAGGIRAQLGPVHANVKQKDLC